MGTFICCKRLSEDTSSIFAPGEEEIDFPEYTSRSDSYFSLIEKKYNLLDNIQLLDYINLLESFNLQTATSHSKVKYRSNFTSKDEFLNVIMYKEEFQSFIENKLLNIQDVLDFFGEDEQTISIFKECFVKLIDSLNVKLNSYYKTNKEQKVTKRNLVGLGLIYCRGQNISKVKIFFELFKNEEEKFVKSEILDNYLIGIFFISSYCLLNIRTSFNMPLQGLPKIENNLAYNLLNGYGLAQKNCENLLKYFNQTFFDKESFTWKEFKNKFGNNKNSFSWIFSTKGIRSKLEDKNIC